MSASSFKTQISLPKREQQHFDISSLYIVKSEIDASLSQVEAAINLYMADQSNTLGLFESSDVMKQTTGILKLLEMDGAIELSDAIYQMLIHISKQPDTADSQNMKDLSALFNAHSDIADDSLITALCEGLMTLSRYLEFVLLREILSPQLLLPMTNTIHRLLKRPLISEGQFLFTDINDDLIQRKITRLVAPPFNKDPASITDQERQHLARLFQTGLNGILRNKPQASDYLYMQSAVAYFADRKTQNAEGLYWQLAKHVISTLTPETELTDGRKRILAQMERRITHQSTASHISQAHAIADLLTMTAILPKVFEETIDTLGLNKKIKPDLDTRHDRQFLFGPDQALAHEVGQLVHQGITRIKELIDLIVNEEQQADSRDNLIKELKELGLTFELLTLNQAGQGLLEQANLVASWTKTPDEKQVNLLMDRLLDSENAIILMEQTHTPGLVMSPFTNLRVSLHQLVEARNLLVTESRTDLGNVINTLLAYQSQDNEFQKIEDIASICEAVSGAMAFLDAPRGQAILQSAAHYIHDHFSPDHQPDVASIVELTDAIVCVDYILEGMATQKPAGDHPYGFGEISLARLGYPVKSAA